MSFVALCVRVCIWYMCVYVRACVRACMCACVRACTDVKAESIMALPTVPDMTLEPLLKWPLDRCPPGSPLCLCRLESCSRVGDRERK